MARLIAGLVTIACLALASVAAASTAPVEVKVERIKPEKATARTLRFLRANLDFLRSQFDYLEERETSGAHAATAIDSTSLAVGALLNEARAARDRAGRVDDAGLRASLEALLAAESSLDQVGAELDAQSSRLASIESLYLESPPTALLVVAKGRPDIPSLRLIDDAGHAQEITLSTSAVLREELAELSYERIEPRRQVLTCALSEREPLYLTIDPAIGAVSVLELDFDAPRGDAPFSARLWSIE